MAEIPHRSRKEIANKGGKWQRSLPDLKKKSQIKGARGRDPSLILNQTFANKGGKRKRSLPETKKKSQIKQSIINPYAKLGLSLSCEGVLIFVARVMHPEQPQCLV